MLNKNCTEPYLVRYIEAIYIYTDSLRLGSAVGEKRQKRGQIVKISASEASPAEAWRGEKAVEPGDMPPTVP